MTHEDDPVQRAVESVTLAMAQAFDEVWSRPDAAELVVGFLSGDVQFQVSRHGVLILAERPADGAAVPDSPAGLE